MPGPYRAIVFINNPISTRMARLGLERDGIAPRQCLVITCRPLPTHGDARWLNDVGALIQYPAPPRFDRRGQAVFAGYYARAATALHRALRRGEVQHIYLVNNDNLLSNHLLRWAEDHPSTRVTTVVEGLMNFQDIQVRNRASWRIDSKRWLARLLGLRWRTPHGHLSGSFEPRTDRVLSFSGVGLHAPQEKVEVVPFPPVTPRRAPAAEGAILAQTGLWQWMNDADRRRFSELFVEFVAARGFNPLYVKKHPNFDTRFIEERLPPHILIGEGTSLEEMAPDLPVRTVVSTNCTALVTLRMLRPDVECIDFGADFYIPTAYHGDASVLALQTAAGVTMVNAGASGGPTAFQTT